MKKMTRKGFTLLEIIISLAIYAVLAMILTEIMTVVNSTIRSADQMTKRLSYEATYADNLQVTSEFTKNPDVKVSISYKYDHTAGRSEKVLNDSTKKHGAMNNGMEYIATYNTDEVQASIDAGTYYHADTNYRFMVFKEASKTDQYPGEVVTFTLWIDPDEADQLGKIVVEPNDTNTKFSDGQSNVSGNQFTISSFDSTNGTSIPIMLVNSAPKDDVAKAATESEWKLSVKITVYKKDTSVKDGLYADATVSFYTGIRVGEIEPVVTYYPETEVSYNFSTKKFAFTRGKEAEST